MLARYICCRRVSGRLSVVRPSVSLNRHYTKKAKRKITLPIFTRASLALRGHRIIHYRVSVCVSVSVTGIISKQLNVGSRKQHHVIAQGL